MSAPRPISPMLDGFILGEAISCHNGVRCYPAIRRNTEEKYIVKVISIPASQVQLEALLLTGALSDKKAALDYFMELSRDMVRQTETLRQLSHQEGFVPYLDAQIVPMEDGVGYEVYLLGTYKQSMDRLLQDQTMTQLGVINMGLDLCAALAACRQAGYLYVDLKPGNIYHSPEHGCRIGDVGFVSLSSLKYASLPEKYRSSYTAPEMADDLAVLNPTVDIYALGLVLYQAYNGGVLPFEGAAPAQMLASPLYADYEMAEIILKACAPDPKDRWQDPTQMAQAIVGYLQRNAVTDSPIIPPPVEIIQEEPEEQIEEFLPEMDEAQLQQELQDLENADPDELAFMSGLTTDETAPSEETAGDVDEALVSDEISEILAQADELIAHELPEPPVAPGPIEVPMPTPIPLEEPEEEAEPTVEAAEETEETEIFPPEEAAEEPAVISEPMIEPQASEPKERPAFRFPWRVAVWVLVAALLIGAAIGGGYYYSNVYVQHVDDLVLEYENDRLTVTVISSIDESLLTVICTDSYGNSIPLPVTNGQAVFTELDPQTRYTVRVQIQGSHKLTGATSKSFTTAAQTNILSFTAGIGPEDGSVLLQLIADGLENDQWVVTYGEDQRAEFSGTGVTITDLVIGTHYTFTLSRADGGPITGQTQTAYTASKIVYARNLAITACGSGSLTAVWEAPEGVQVNSWTVRCYNAFGYAQSVTTTDCTYTFTDLDHTKAYTVDVIADGMSQSVSTTIGSNPITISDIRFEMTDGGHFTVTWDHTGTAPVGGWTLVYTMDGVPQQSVKSESNSVSLLAIPGCQYTFALQVSDGTPIFGGTAVYQVAEADSFADHGITADDLTLQLCLRPEDPAWLWSDVAPEDHRTSFAPGELGALILSSAVGVEAADSSVSILFVIRDSEGNLLSADIRSLVWNEMWPDDHCALDIPFLPEQMGEYTLQLYFDGALAAQQAFSIA